MTRFSKTLLLMGTAVLALGACSTEKGPGKLGTKDDIVVKNNGMPPAAAAAPAATAQAAKAPGEDFSSTVEQGTANPAPEVAGAEPVPAPTSAQTAAATAPAPVDPNKPMPDNSPAMASAVKQQQAVNAPLTSTTGANPVDEATAAPSETRPLDAMAPIQPVNAAVTPPDADAAANVATPSPTPSSVYPTADYAATPTTTAATAPSSAATPAPAPYTPPAPMAASTVPYPLDKNAPYSPKAVAAAQAAAGSPPSAAPATAAAAPAATPASGGITDPTTIRAVQAALAAKAAYTGPQTGNIDADFLNALTKYQGEKGLPMGGLNDATLTSLGVAR